MMGSSLYDIMIQKFQEVGLSVQWDGKSTISIDYNENSATYLEKLFLDFCGRDGYNIRFTKSIDRACFVIGMQNKQVPSTTLFDSVLDSLEGYDSGKNYREELNVTSEKLYQLFLESFRYEGNFGIGLQGDEKTPKCVIKTDMDDFLNILQDIGLNVRDNRVIITQDEYSSIESVLGRIHQEILKQQEMKEEKDVDLEKTDVVDLDSKVDIYEKIMQDKSGQSVVVRLSVTKQTKTDHEIYERLVNVSYIARDSGITTNQQVFGYEDGYAFDHDVLPHIIDGFSRDAELAGRKVSVKENQPNSCYIQYGDGEDSISLDDYSVDHVRSLLTYEEEHHLFGDEDGKLDLQQLHEDNVVSSTDNGLTFEEDVTDQSMSEDIPVDEEQYDNDSPKLVKRLGEMPSNSGIANWMGILLFLTIDVVAIVVGVYLLLH